MNKGHNVPPCSCLLARGGDRGNRSDCFIHPLTSHLPCCHCHPGSDGGTVLFLKCHFRLGGQQWKLLSSRGAVTLPSSFLAEERGGDRLAKQTRALLWR